MKRREICGIFLALSVGFESYADACSFESEDKRSDFVSCKKEAENGYPNSEYYLAKMYELGYGVEINNGKALYWYKSSAQKGENKEVTPFDAFSTESQYELGLIYLHAKDLEKTVYWTEQAAKRHHAKAQYLLATLYAHGEGAPQNFKKAVYWATKSADSGFVYAQALLASYYKEGAVAERDLTKSIVWLQKAANSDHPESQFLLGVASALGDGVPKNNEKALYWYNRSAENGYVKALTALSLIYDGGGLDLKKDTVKAYAYASLAVAMGNEAGKSYRDSLMNKLSKEQISESQQLSENILLKIRQSK